MNETIEQHLREGNPYVSTTVGWSMKPMLRNRRDRIVLSPVGDRTLAKYDLPLYKRPDGKYVLHRVIGVGDGFYYIRGDNTYVVEKVPFAWVIGYVTEFYRGKKHYTADQRSYRRYAAFWNAIYPMRSFFHKCKLLAVKVKHAIFGKKNAE